MLQYSISLLGTVAVVSISGERVFLWLDSSTTALRHPALGRVLGLDLKSKGVQNGATWTWTNPTGPGKLDPCHPQWLK